MVKASGNDAQYVVDAEIIQRKVAISLVRDSDGMLLILIKSTFSEEERIVVVYQGGRRDSPYLAVEVHFIYAISEVVRARKKYREACKRESLLAAGMNTRGLTADTPLNLRVAESPACWLRLSA